MKARALYVVSRSPPDAAVSVRYPSKINICWWLRPTLFILLGLGCGLWSADVRLWFAFLFSSHLPADVQMFRNIKVVFVGLAAFWIAHYHTTLTIWTLEPHLDTRYQAKHLTKRCLYSTFWNVKTIALALKLKTQSIVSHSWWSTPVIPLLGHLCELEMNWFRTSTKNHQNTSWFKNIKQK